MPPKSSSTSTSLSSPKKSKAKSDPFGGMLSLTGSAIPLEKLKQQEAAFDQQQQQHQTQGLELIGKSDTTTSSKNQDSATTAITTTKDDEEILCSNNVGTDADREFDELIGAIENFLVSEHLEKSRAEYFSKLPSPFAKTKNDNNKEEQQQQVEIPQQQKYIYFKQFVELIDNLLDEYITNKFPKKSVEEMGMMIMERKDQVSMDVLELVSGGEESGLDYESFIQMWEMYTPAEDADDEGNNQKQEEEDDDEAAK